MKSKEKYFGSELRATAVVPGGRLATLTPILFIHGMWEGPWIWERWARWFAERGVPSYALGLRGHGSSDVSGPLGHVGLDEYAADIRAALPHIGPAIPIGHSMGGFLAQRVAAECPSLVAKAVFVTSAPPAGILLQGSVLWRMAQPYVAGAMLRKTELQIRWGDARALELNCMSEEDARSAFDRLVPESGLAARQLANPFFGWVDPAKLSCPTMVVAASKDKMLPPAVQRAIARRYGSEYWEYSGGHMLPIEQHWEVPLPDILRFINT